MTRDGNRTPSPHHSLSPSPSLSIAYPFHKVYRITSTYQDHLDRDPPSTAPGLDLAAPMHTPILAPFAGHVHSLGHGGAGGRQVTVYDGSPPIYIVHYAHLDKFAALEDTPLQPGQVIGYTGNTGNSTGPHLHLDLRINGKYIDPQPYLDMGREDKTMTTLPTAWAHRVHVSGYVEMELDDQTQEITVEAHQPAAEPQDLATAIRAPAFSHLQVPRNDNAALLKYARAHNLGAPLTPEYYAELRRRHLLLPRLRRSHRLCHQRPMAHHQPLGLVGNWYNGPRAGSRQPVPNMTFFCFSVLFLPALCAFKVSFNNSCNS